MWNRGSGIININLCSVNIIVVLFVYMYVRL